MTRFFQVLAWLMLIGIAAATLSPIDLRPRLAVDVDLERALAFCATGFAFALAYPRQMWLAAVITVAGTLGLEVLQELRPDRHGRFHDAFIKVAGALVGLGLGWVVSRLYGQRSRPAP